MKLYDTFKKWVQEATLLRREGFVLVKDNNDLVAKAGWKETNFVRQPVEDAPQLRLKILRHNEYGTIVAINPIPVSYIYQFCTPRPIKSDEVFETIKEYFESVRSGNRYMPKRY